MQAKLAARRERRLAEEQRIAEEMAAQKWLEEQDRQMRRGALAPSEGDLFKAPQVTYTESLEEAALKKEQVPDEMCVHVNLRNRNKMCFHVNLRNRYDTKCVSM